MDITAIVTDYWEERVNNLPHIIDALLRGSLKPKEIIIWNNDLRPTSAKWFGNEVKFIQANHNYGSGSWLAASALAENKLIFQQDNDVMVEKGTLANLADYASDQMGWKWFNLEGRVFNSLEYSYRKTDYILGATLKEPKIVNVGLAKMSLVSKAVCLSAIKELDPISKIVDDDIWFSRIVYPWVVPFKKGQGFIALSEGGVGLSLEAEHWDRRDKLTRKLWGGK